MLDFGNREIKIQTVLGESVLLVHKLDGRESVSELFKYSLELISEDNGLSLDTLLGTDVSLSISLPVSDDVAEGAERFIHGYVADCARIPSDDEYAHYRVTVRPWFWFLTRKTDCRIFQDLAVPDIIKQVFDEAGFTEVDNRLTASYETRRYCVQYDESTFTFLSRLMEHEGVYYFFEHHAHKHTLVLCDSYPAHGEYAGYETIPWYPLSGSQLRERDHLHLWSQYKQLQPGRYATRDYNFETPKSKLEATREAPGEHTHSDYEVFDYPGGYPSSTGEPVSATGESLAQHRMEALAAQRELATGSGNVRALMTGYLFKLRDCDLEDQNREYLIVESSVSASIANYQGGEGSGLVFASTVSAIPSQQQYRPQRITTKPCMKGPQTAHVTGPAGEEIWTDNYGRVKLQFHWDRYGESDENSSCWVRVSQLWAGQGWGAVHIPRIGQEVIVEFLDGDPDRPIITGRVYNGDNGVPYGLPNNQTQSGIKSRSTKGGGGGNFNEIRMEDKMGAEQLYIHAEKNQDNIVENNENTSVGHNRSESVGNDETIDIGNNRTESVGVNESVTIGANRSVTVGSNKTETVTINKAESIGVSKELTIGGLYQVSVGGVMNETVALAKSQEVGAVKATVVGGMVTEKYNSSQSTDVSSDKNTTVGKSFVVNVAEDKSIKVGKTLLIDVADEITIQTGKASITLKKDGTIDISGKDITLKASGAIKQKAKKNIVMEGKKILQN